jgi:hypothetical protein
MLALIKLSGARDDELTKDVWKELFDKGTSSQVSLHLPRLSLMGRDIAKNAASELLGQDKYQPYRNLTVNLGQNLYPSETAFPICKFMESLYGIFVWRY